MTRHTGHIHAHTHSLTDSLTHKGVLKKNSERNLAAALLDERGIDAGGNTNYSCCGRNVKVPLHRVAVVGSTRADAHAHKIARIQIAQGGRKADGCGAVEGHNIVQNNNVVLHHHKGRAIRACARVRVNSPARDLVETGYNQSILSDGQGVVAGA